MASVDKSPLLSNNQHPFGQPGPLHRDWSCQCQPKWGTPVFPRPEFSDVFEDVGSVFRFSLLCLCLAGSIYAGSCNAGLICSIRQSSALKTLATPSIGPLHHSIVPDEDFADIAAELAGLVVFGGSSSNEFLQVLGIQPPFQFDRLVQTMQASDWLGSLPLFCEKVFKVPITA